MEARSVGRTPKHTAEVHARRRARARDGRPVALAPGPLAEHAAAEAREPRVNHARANAVDPDEEARVGDPEPLVRAHAHAEEAERVRVEVVAPEVHGLLEARRAAFRGDEGLEVEGFLCWFPLRRRRRAEAVVGLVLVLVRGGREERRPAVDAAARRPSHARRVVAEAAVGQPALGHAEDRVAGAAVRRVDGGDGRGAAVPVRFFSLVSRRRLRPRSSISRVLLPHQHAIAAISASRRALDTPSLRHAKSDCHAARDGVVNVQSHVLGAADLRARVYAAERKDAARDRCGIGSASRSAQLRSASRASNARRTPDASWRSARRFRP